MSPGSFLGVEPALGSRYMLVGPLVLLSSGAANYSRPSRTGDIRAWLDDRQAWPSMFVSPEMTTLLRPIAPRWTGPVLGQIPTSRPLRLRFFRSDSLRVCWRIRFRTSHFHHGIPFPFWALLLAYCLSNLVKHWSGCPFFWALGPICCLGRFQIDLTNPRLAFVCSMPRRFAFLPCLWPKQKIIIELHTLLFYSLFFIILSGKNNIFPHLKVGATPNHQSITQEWPRPFDLVATTIRSHVESSVIISEISIRVIDQSCKIFFWQCHHIGTSINYFEGTDVEVPRRKTTLRSIGSKNKMKVFLIFFKDEKEP